jgi:hypothetical protein
MTFSIVDETEPGSRVDGPAGFKTIRPKRAGHSVADADIANRAWRQGTSAAALH